MFLKPGPFSRPVWCPWWDSPSFSLNTHRDELFQGHLSPFTVPWGHQVTLVQGRMWYWSARAVITKYYRLGALNPHKLTFSQFWRLKIKELVGLVSRRLSSWLADATLLLPAYTVIPLGMPTPALSCSAYGISHMGLGRHPSGPILSPLEWPYLTGSSWMGRILPSSSWAASF